MSTPQTAGRTPAPGDDDLQHLYDEVWRIFDEEASETERPPVAAVTTSNVRESLNNHVRVEVDTFGQPVLSSRAVTASPRPPLPPPPPAHPAELRATPDSAVSPTTQKRLRPLPLPPGAVLPPTTGGVDSHKSITPPISSASRPANMGTEGRRQLPQAPGAQPNGNHSSHPSTGSVTSPTASTSRIPAASSPLDALPNLNKPVPAVPMYVNGQLHGVEGHDSQLPQSSSDPSDHGFRKRFVRPPGASAPMIPGHSTSYDESLLLDMYAEEPQKAPLGHRQRDLEQAQLPDNIPSQANVRYHPYDGHNEIPVSSRQIDDRSPSASLDSNQPRDGTEQGVNVALGRAISTGSTASSMLGDMFSRHPTVSTAATTYNIYQPSTSEVGLTTLARDDSVGSYAIPSAGPSTSYMTHAFADSVDDY
ncbi:hypothetical protein PISMIDRAFT_79717, partial [Pisolithus microcarpus 441]